MGAGTNAWPRRHPSPAAAQVEPVHAVWCPASKALQKQVQQLQSEFVT